MLRNGPSSPNSNSSKVYRVGTPNTGDRQAFLRRMEDILDRRWLTNNGKYVVEFEQKFAQLADMPHCISVCNATLGLQLLIRALGLTGEVILPAFTFVATAHSLEWEGLTPVFCDVDPVTHNLDPEAVEAAITPRTSAIMGVHLWGRGCAVEELETIARRHHLKLIYDAAHATGCTTNGRSLFAYGDAAVVSFHATKSLTTFEGGAILTRDRALADKLKRMRSFGFSGTEEVVELGTNAKMCEPAAAMGLASMEDFPNTVAENKARYRQYLQELGGIPELSVVRYPENELNSYQYMLVRVDESCPLTRDALMDILATHRIITRRYFYPGCHRLEPYRSRPAVAELSLPETDLLAGTLMALPTGHSLPEHMIPVIGGILRSAIQKAAAAANARVPAARQDKNVWTSELS
jgi:dTDP-4-amino-4,6-dideoxygalactose transaminase